LVDDGADGVPVEAAAREELAQLTREGAFVQARKVAKARAGHAQGVVQRGRRQPFDGGVRQVRGDSEMAKLAANQARPARAKRLALRNPVLSELRVIDEVVPPKLDERGLDRGFVESGTTESTRDFAFAPRARREKP
jgi:hypothetical protein